MYLVVGLGNPGKEYDNTRHNIGFAAIDSLASELNINVEKEKCGALIGQGETAGVKVMLAKPQTFMNLSGNSVSSLVNWFKIDPRKIILIYDDLDLDVGDLRIRPKGSSAGHKGVESVIAAMKTNDIMRVRIGIGNSENEAADYVLSKIPKGESELLGMAVQNAVEATRTIIKAGIGEAMNRFNPKA